MSDGDKVRDYMDIDVYSLAVERVNYIVDNYDSIYVAFSGGKDSLAVLELFDMIYKERGIQSKVKVIHRDEEFIPDEVVEFVDQYVRSDRFDFQYLCLQLKHFRFCLGEKKGYVKWDERRKWLRDKPSYAISDPDNVYDQYSADVFATREGKGRKIIVTGVRAAESLTRLVAICNSPESDHLRVQIAKNEKSGVELARPLYDWEEKDIFKFFYDFNIKYCGIYDKQIWQDDALRVASSTSVENAKKLTVIKERYPVYFNQITEVFPDLRVQERYWKDCDLLGAIEKYPKSWQGLKAYIDENLQGEQRKLAITRMKQCMQQRQNRMKSGKGIENLYGYPILYVFEQICKGQFKRPIAAQIKARKKDFSYEGI